MCAIALIDLCSDRAVYLQLLSVVAKQRVIPLQLYVAIVGSIFCAACPC